MAITFLSCGHSSVMHDEMIVYQKKEVVPDVKSYSYNDRYKFEYYLKSVNNDFNLDYFVWYTNNNYNIGDTIR